MHETLVSFLRCPVDGVSLSLAPGATFHDGRVVEGALVSASGRSYRVTDGVPDLTLGFSSDAERATVRTFQEEWGRYDDFEGAMGSAELFTTFSGLTAADVSGKRVLEVGCGGGRWLKVLAEWGAARVVGLELSGSVRQAFRRVAALPQVDVVRGSAMQMPLARAFDLVISIGVVHHLADPVRGLTNVGSVLTTPHLVVFWVYAREGNEFYLAIVRPLRVLTNRLPDAALAGLSKALGVALWAYIRSINRLALRARLPLPLRDYLAMLESLRFRDLESVVYDQLGPSIARYPTEQEVRDWAARAGASVVRLHHRTSNSWQCHCVFGRTGDDAR